MLATSFMFVLFFSFLFVVKSREKDIENLRREIASFNESQEGKVDKQIIKSLLISYFATPANRRQEGERLLARFLDFNAEEMERAGIRIGRQSAAAQESFSSKFVEFLEVESSKPLDGGAGGHAHGAPNNQTIQLARDLNKRLTNFNKPYVSNVSSNFISSVPGPSSRSGHSRQSSRSSLSSLTDNQLLIGSHLLTPPVNLVATPVAPDISEPSASSNVIEKLDIV